jgi:hypothetical protein
MIVLSSDTAIKDLLDKRSAIYSSRTDMYMGKIASGGLRMLLMVYGLKHLIRCCDPDGVPGIRRDMAHAAQDLP